MEFDHETVLLEETIDNLEVNPNGVYVDCTLGGAGHAQYILAKLSERGHLFAFDQDSQAIENAQIVLAKEIQEGKVTLIHQNFRLLKEELTKRNITYVDGIYFDLGVSSPQLDQGERGFSYRLEAPLDMRMNQKQELSANDVVNTWDFNDLVRIISRYGEEKFAKRIARAIEKHRELRPINTTTELAEIVKEAIPAATRRTGGHPAKRTFQAIRIAVNDELGALEAALEQAASVLKVGGRLSVISFHSLEDRMVKQFFKELSSLPESPPNLPILPGAMEADYRLINRKPIISNANELDENNRARSAKLRVLERIKIS